MTKAFTLLEVLVSVVILFMIGMTLVQISSQNVHALENLKIDRNSYASAVINSHNEYASLYDYLYIYEIPKFDVRVEKKNIIIGEVPLISTKQFKIVYTLSKDIIKINDESKAYYRIK